MVGKTTNISLILSFSLDIFCLTGHCDQICNKSENDSLSAGHKGTINTSDMDTIQNTLISIHLGFMLPISFLKSNNDINIKLNTKTKTINCKDLIGSLSLIHSLIVAPNYLALLYFSSEGRDWGSVDRVDQGGDDSSLFRDKSHNSLWLILTHGTSLREQICPD